MTDVIVVDLSHHNPEPDWQALVIGGTLGVILKCTEGTSYLDPTYGDRVEQAEDVGLYVSAYHFLKHGNVSQQIDWFLVNQGLQAGSRLVIDYEDEACTLDDLHEAVNCLLADGRYEITVYSGHLIKEQLGSDYDGLLAANTSLWIAQYTSAPAPSWPTTTWPVWSLWQYTDACTVEGCSAPVDANRWNGDPDHLGAWFSQDAGPTPVQSTIEMSMTVAHGTKITLTINGEVTEYVAA